MAKTVIALIDDASQAQRAVEELLQSGFRREDIGMISSDVAREAAAALGGTTKGLAVGGLAGLLVGAAAIAIPGIGAAIAAGPAIVLASTALGGLAGGIIGGLTAKGVPEAEAHFYAEGLRRGGVLVTVNAESDELAERAVAILKKYGAADINQRAGEWKSQGWSGRFGGAGGKQARADTEKSAQQERPAAQSPAPSEPAQPAAASEPGQPAAASPDRQRAEAEPLVAAGVIPLGAVCVYDVVLELAPEEKRRRAERPAYKGTERRFRSAPYGGADRRSDASMR